MKTMIMKHTVMMALSFFLTLIATAQGVKIGDTQGSPDASAIFEAQSTTKGLLPPRMTTAERNAISSPAHGLLIFNTTTECYEGYNGTSASWYSFGCLCSVPTAASASASPNPVCEGSTLSLVGSATGATSWSWTGPNGFTSSVQNPSIPNITLNAGGIYTLTASNMCGSSVVVIPYVVNIAPAPTTATAGADQNVACGTSTTTLAGNTPNSGIGTWTVVSGTATITTPSSPTSGVTGLAIPGTAVLRWTIVNGACSSYDDVTINTSDCPFICGTNTVTDVNGNVYNTVLIGGIQCWMKENLKTGTFVSVGTTQTNNGTVEKHCQNISGFADSTCPLGGLYQWNEMMNYQASCNGSGAPPSDKCSTPVQGICPTGWHIPSHYEWTTLEKNVGSNPNSFTYDETATGWKGSNEGNTLKATTSWTTPNTNSNTSGFTALPAGSSSGGGFYTVASDGYWWSSTDSGINAWRRNMNYSDARVFRTKFDKTTGYAVRCLKN